MRSGSVGRAPPARTRRVRAHRSSHLLRPAARQYPGRSPRHAPRPAFRRRVDRHQDAHPTTGTRRGRGHLRFHLESVRDGPPPPHLRPAAYRGRRIRSKDDDRAPAEPSRAARGSRRDPPADRRKDPGAQQRQPAPAGKRPVLGSAARPVPGRGTDRAGADRRDQRLRRDDANRVPGCGHRARNRGTWSGAVGDRRAKAPPAGEAERGNGFGRVTLVRFNRSASRRTPPRRQPAVPHPRPPGG